MMERYRHLHRIILMVVLQGGFPGSYSKDRAITLPESIRALRGSCVEIPCTFTRPRGNKDFRLVWYKGIDFRPDKIIFSQQNPSDVSEGNRGRTSLVGNEPNSCSLRINDVRESDSYYPYIHGNCDVTSVCQTVRVTVSDVPNEPAIQIPTDLTEGERTNISCSVEHTCPPRPPTLQWNRAGYKLTDRQQSLKDGVWKAETVMGYLPSYRDHKAKLECEATYPNGLKSKSRSAALNIRYSPKNVAVVISYGKKERKEGDAVSLTCASDANPAANAFTWYNNKRDGTVELREEQGRSITVTVGRGRETFSCAAGNPLGTGNSNALELHVLYPPKNVTVSILDGNLDLTNVTLICTCFARPAVKNYTWYRDRQGQVTTFEEQSAEITINIGPEKELYFCSATNQLGVGFSSHVDLQHLLESSSYKHGLLSPTALVSYCVGVIGILSILLIVCCIWRRRNIQSSSSKQKSNRDNSKPTEDIYMNC